MKINSNNHLKWFYHLVPGVLFLFLGGGGGGGWVFENNQFGKFRVNIFLNQYFVCVSN